jgi:hypothetical protein
LRFRTVLLVVACAFPLEHSARADEADPEPVSVAFRSTVPNTGFDVSVGGQSCDTPCSLNLLPGPYQLRASGSDTLKYGILVPKTGGIVRLRPAGNNLILPGTLLMILGAVTAPLGAVGVACEQLPGCTSAQAVVWPVLGMAMFWTGVGLLGYASTHALTRLFVEPFYGDDPSATVTGFHLRLASVGLQPIANGAMGALALSF